MFVLIIDNLLFRKYTRYLQKKSYNNVTSIYILYIQDYYNALYFYLNNRTINSTLQELILVVRFFVSRLRMSNL